MALVPTCDICGTPEEKGSIPPNLEQIQVRDSVANYDSLLCRTCKATKTLQEIIDHSVARPGGTAEGAQKLIYLVRHKP